MESSKPKHNSSTNLGEVEEKLGYKFNDPILLKQALTHHSYQEIVDDEDKTCASTYEKSAYSISSSTRLNTPDGASSSYERLEYIGDSVLNLLMAREDFLLYPHLKPGTLTRLRAANVDTEKLARVAIHHKLHHYLLHRKPLLSGQIEEFSNAISHYPLHSNGLIDPPKVLADIVESIIGAVYVDCNFSMEITWQVVKSLVQPIITPKSLQIHPMTKLYEMCQKNGVDVKIIDLWKKTGEIEVFVNHEFAGRGEYPFKKIIALNRAANNAYNHIMESKFGMEDKTSSDDDLNISSLFVEHKEFI